MPRASLSMRRSTARVITWSPASSPWGAASAASRAAATRCRAYTDTYHHGWCPRPTARPSYPWPSRERRPRRVWQPLGLGLELVPSGPPRIRMLRVHRSAPGRAGWCPQHPLGSHALRQVIQDQADPGNHPPLPALPCLLGQFPIPGAAHLDGLVRISALPAEVAPHDESTDGRSLLYLSVRSPLWQTETAASGGVRVNPVGVMLGPLRVGRFFRPAH